MDFAKRQLEKYGWKEGQGLGKNDDGISTALKPKLKFDKTGLGHQLGKDFTNKWWENVYDNAAKNIEVVKDHKAVKVKRVSNADEVEITTKDYSVKDFQKKNDTMEYGTFLNTAKLTKDGVVNYNNVHTPVEDAVVVSKQLTDEELFAVCGGRTAHKGARHGLKLSGKLSRIEKQEKMLLKKMQRVQLNEAQQPAQENYSKKLKKLRRISETLIESECTSTPSMSEQHSLPTVKGKKKKRKKSVSFSETVLEYTVQEPEAAGGGGDDDDYSPSSSSTGERVEVHERHLAGASHDGSDAVTTDEGIELDCDAKHLGCGGQECFSEMQHHGLKGRRRKRDAADEVKKRRKARDVDGVGRIKRRRKYRHNEIEGIGTSLEDLQISE